MVVATVVGSVGTYPPRYSTPISSPFTETQIERENIVLSTLSDLFNDNIIIKMMIIKDTMMIMILLLLQL